MSILDVLKPFMSKIIIFDFLNVRINYFCHLEKINIGNGSI